MQLLREMLEESNTANLKEMFKDCVKTYKKVKTKNRLMIKEGLMSDHNGELEQQFDEIVSRLKAAHRALSIIPKLPKEEQRQHKSRVFKNMNHINKMLYDIMMKLGYSDTEHQIEFPKKQASNKLPDNSAYRREGERMDRSNMVPQA